MNYTNIYNLPQSIVDAVLETTYDLRKSDPNRLGVTTLINPPRIRQLTIKHWDELEEDISDHLWRITGNAYHYVLGKAKKIGRDVEKPIEIMIDGLIIVGKPDIYEYETIEDHKITSVWAVNDIKDDWIKQVNSYVWLKRKIGFSVKKGYVNAILRDWRKIECIRFGKTYPPIPFKSIEIPIWSFEQQDKYIRERITIWKEALKLDADELPICSDIERWKAQDKFAIHKGKNKSATRVLDNMEDIKKYMKQKKLDNKNYNIIKRPGCDLRCTLYCLPNKVCKYWKDTYGTKT